MTPDPFGSNILYYGDNLEVLRKHFPDECVDLIYLDPPFNSKADYNILFKEASGEKSVAQIQAFSDFWQWDRVAEKTYLEIQENPNLTEMIQFLHAHLGRNDMLAYLVMMTIRLRELHRVLKPTGALYLHCDQTASHYLKVILDKVFGPKNFRNEIIWHYRGREKVNPLRFATKHDVLLFYAKTEKMRINEMRIEWDRADRIKMLRRKIHTEPKTGRKWFWETRGQSYGIKPYKRDLEEYLKKGQAYSDTWIDIPKLRGNHPERLGYPTQKPVALVERIIDATTNEGDWVLDPFCGCGTAIIAAHNKKRKWIGIDITHLAISLIKSRLREMHVKAGKDYQIIGEPADLASAINLAKADKYQFQWWALSLIEARPTGQSSENPKQGKKGADKGIDGWLTFKESDTLNLQKIVVQVKGGENIGVGDVRDLIGTVDSRKAAMGILITLYEPTRPMKEAAMEAEYYKSKIWGHKYPKVQLITIQELFEGKKPIIPYTSTEGKTQDGLARWTAK
jgi:site-specific DNA-methyltransferase (adenine-specific)